MILIFLTSNHNKFPLKWYTPENLLKLIILWLFFPFLRTLCIANNNMWIYVLEKHVTWSTVAGSLLYFIILSWLNELLKIFSTLFLRPRIFPHQPCVLSSADTMAHQGFKDLAEWFRESCWFRSSDNFDSHYKVCIVWFLVLVELLLMRDMSSLRGRR